MVHFVYQRSAYVKNRGPSFSPAAIAQAPKGFYTIVNY